MHKSKIEAMLYQRPESPFWYFQMRDPVTGKLERKSTKKRDKQEALRIVEKAIQDSCTQYATPTSPLERLLTVYASPDTNPRKLEAEINGTNYGAEYAYHIASYARELREILRKGAPSFLKRKLKDITRLDIKNIKAVLVKAKGRCRQSQAIFMAFKGFFVQAVDDGILAASPATNIPDIRYSVKKRCSIESSLLRNLIAHPEIFSSEEDWAFFTLLATTGMRKSEVLALNTEQLHDGVLTIDRALKGTNSMDVGLPKWDLIRVIPLSEITQRAFAALSPSPDGRLFPHGRDWGWRCFQRCQAAAMAFMPEHREIWQSMTAHILRHSMNTNLLIAGENPLFVAEYLSWSHQVLIDMQTRYTHLMAQNLRGISDAIDSMYNPEKIDGIAEKERKFL